MCLEMQCDRCQGYFRNFTQIVRKGVDTYCVQCDAAIKAGAESRMYAEDLPCNSIFDVPPGHPLEADLVGDRQ